MSPLMRFYSIFKRELNFVLPGAESDLFNSLPSNTPTSDLADTPIPSSPPPAPRPDPPSAQSDKKKRKKHQSGSGDSEKKKGKGKKGKRNLQRFLTKA